MGKGILLYSTYRIAFSCVSIEKYNNRHKILQKVKWRGHTVHRWSIGDQILTMSAVVFSRQSGRSRQEEWSALRNLHWSHQPTSILKDKEPKPDRCSTLAEVFFFSSSYFLFSSSLLLWSLLQTSIYCWKKRTGGVFLTRPLWREVDKNKRSWNKEDVWSKLNGFVTERN